jgi:hypothetical protein
MPGLHYKGDGIHKCEGVNLFSQHYVQYPHKIQATKHLLCFFMAKSK